MFQKNYAKLYDEMYRDKPYKKEIEFVYKWADNPKTILDLGCGTASYWKYFPEGIKIAGIEKSRAMREQSPHKQKIITGDISEYGVFDAEHPEFKKIIGKPIVDTAYALFDVFNYVYGLNPIRVLPIKKGGYLIFDIWDTQKIQRQGFRKTTKIVEGIKRTIYPLDMGYMVNLGIKVESGGKSFVENHDMYLHTERDIKAAASGKYEIVDKKETRTWQKWYKLMRI